MSANACARLSASIGVLLAIAGLAMNSTGASSRAESVVLLGRTSLENCLGGEPTCLKNYSQITACTGQGCSASQSCLRVGQTNECKRVTYSTYDTCTAQNSTIQSTNCTATSLNDQCVTYFFGQTDQMGFCQQGGCNANQILCGEQKVTTKVEACPK
jgi:hypothetical protein